MEASRGKNQRFTPLQIHHFQPLKILSGDHFLCLRFPFLPFTVGPPLPLYCSKWIFFFLEEEELGTFWYHMCLT